MEGKYKEAAEILSYIDTEQSKLIIEFSFVGVEKENITLMMRENGCYLYAPTEDSDYAATLAFVCRVKPSEATASFKDGFLVVEVPLQDDLKDAVQVQVD